MELFQFDPFIENVADFQGDDTTEKLSDSLSKFGINIDRMRVNSTGAKAKTLTPHWYKNKPMKNYAFNFGDAMLHFFVDKKSGVLVRLMLEDVVIEDNKKGVKKSVKQVAKDIQHAYHQVKSLEDKGNAIEMDIDSKDLDKLLKGGRTSKTDKALIASLEERKKSLTKGSGKYLIANKAKDAFWSDVEEGFGNDNLVISIYEREEAKERAKNIDDAFYTIKI